MLRLVVPTLIALTALTVCAWPAAAQPGVSYDVPPDNPFASTPGAAPEIYSLGLRNPFRFSFDRQSGALLIGDVGGSNREEVDFTAAGAARGANFGWPCREGKIAGPGGCTAPGAVEPLFDYDAPGPVAVTGGYVVRDTSLTGLVGRYLYADFYAGDIRSLQLDAGNPNDTSTGLTIGNLAAFGEDAAARLYAVDLDGPVYRLVAGAAPGTLATENVGTFTAPMYLASPPGDATRLFIVERSGTIRVVSSGTTLPQPFLDISSNVSTAGERGLLSMVFAPDYATSGRFYVNYTDLGGDIRIDEFRVSGDPDVADAATRRNLMTIEHSAFDNHNGGTLQFGPDGHLYISTGDGGGNLMANGQDLSTPLGKLLRIQPVLRSAPSGTSTTPPASPVGGGPDLLPPFLRTRFARRQRIVRQRGVIGYVRSNETGSFRGLARVSVPGGSRLFRFRGVRRAVRAGRLYRIKLRLGRRARRAVARAQRKRRVSVRVELRVRDAAGNLTRSRLRVRARR